jgi:hypothetical protein
MAVIKENPFRVFSPEGLPAQDFIEIFVSDVPGGNIVLSPGHSWIHGPRGSGKSMLLRFLEPDCQLIMRGHKVPDIASFASLKFFAIYASARQFDNDFPEFGRLRGEFAEAAVAEHSLVLSLVQHSLSRVRDNGIFACIGELPIPSNPLMILNRLLKQLGAQNPSDDITISSGVQKLLEGLWDAQLGLDSYLDRLVDSKGPVPFQLQVLRHKTFFEPFVDFLSSLPGISAIQKFYVVVDDADKLTDAQTKVFNTWISRRSSKVSIKFSSEEYQYKTFYTKGDYRIEHPHDFSELNLTDIYTSNHNKSFRDRMYQMVNKRLQRFGTQKDALGRVLNATAYFPEDHSQVESMKRINKELREASSETRKGRDDAYRYSRPNYMLSLSGSSKNRPNYSYSGFDQLVNISSGNPRFFLEAAHEMFDRQQSKSTNNYSSPSIDASVQNAVLRDKANDLFLDELDELKLDGSNRNKDYKAAIYLQGFIGSLGQLFESILYNSTLSERRVFSFAISDAADDEVEKVLRLGVVHAYLTRTSIGRKEGVGKTPRYVLSRRFAPYFNLDPNGFSAYKFLTNEEIRRMMFEPESFRKALRARRVVANDAQLKLDFLE